MSTKDGNCEISPYSVAQPFTPRLADQSDRTSQDKFFFQPPITADRPQTSKDGHRNEWKRISCDFCRRRKVKCDKREPCGQCSISFRDCIYTRRFKLGKNRPRASSSKLDAIEKRTEAIESNEHYFPPAVDVTGITPSPNLHPINPPSEGSQTYPGHYISQKTDSEEIGKCATAHHCVAQGEIEFHGTSADRVFMEELMEKLGDSSVTHHNIPVDASIPGLFQSDSGCFDEVLLPSRDQAMKLVEAALGAQVLFHLVHRPSFDFSFDMIYTLESREYSIKEKRFLPLLYAVFAYGSLFVDPYAEKLEYREVITRASRYFLKSKQLQDIASCNDLVSLQAIVFKNLFLLNTARLPLSYTYLCTSMSVALRMGLHRSFPNPQDLISREISKRLFWALRLLSLDIATCVGLPTLINDEDSDQELPLEVNDAYIQRGKVTRQPPNEVCYSSGSICYSRLHGILQKVLKDVYPKKSRTSVGVYGSMSYTVKGDTIRQIEQELEKWATMIPFGYRLGTYHREISLQRAQFILALTYSYIQIRLYRPFLRHDIESTEHRRLQSSTRLSPCTSACIQACQNVIELCEDMCRWGLLTEANWPVTRILTSCMLTSLYILIMDQDPHQEELLFKSLITGRKILHIMETRSNQAQRCKTMFKILISSLSIKFDHIREKLMKYERIEAPSLQQYDLSSVCGASTELLGEKVFTLSSKTYLRSHSGKICKCCDYKTNANNFSHQHNIPQDLKDAASLQPRLSLSQTNPTNAQILTPTVPKSQDVSPKSEDPSIQDPLEPSNSQAGLVPSVPSPMTGNSMVTDPAMGLHQQDLNGSWTHAFDSITHTGSVCSPMKDLIGGASLYMNDINELSDIWDWF